MDKVTEGHNTVKNSRVSVIVLNWNGWQDTVECLGSLEKLETGNLKIDVIVCDNGSTDDSLERLRAFKIQNSRFKIHVIENRANLGFAGGNNPGIRYAMEQGADYVFLLNNDTIIQDGDFLQKLVAVGESDPTIGILGPFVLFADDPEKIHFAGGKINFWMNRAEHIGLGEKMENGKWKTVRPYEVDYITGAAMLVKRQVIEKIGLMNESYFLYYEDSDWCIRARKAGFRCIMVSEARILHKVSRSTRPGSSSYISYHVRNGLYLAWRNGGLLRRFFAIFWGLVTLLKQPPKLLISSKRQWVLPTARGVVDFFRGKTGQII